MKSTKKVTGYLLASFSLLFMASGAQADEDNNSVACRILGTTVGGAIVYAGAQTGTGLVNAIGVIALAAGAEEAVNYGCNNSDEAAEAALEAYNNAMINSGIYLNFVINGQFMWRGIPPEFYRCLDINNCEPLVPPETSFGQRQFALDAWDVVSSIVSGLDNGNSFTSGSLSVNIANSFNNNFEGSLSTYESIYTNLGGN